MGDYEEAVAIVVEQAVLDVFSTFTGEEVYTDRTRLTAEVNAAAVQRLQHILFESKMVNIVNMDLPQSYMDAIVETQVAAQKIQEVQYLKEGEEIQGQTNISVATENKLKQIALATQEGEIYKKYEQKKGEALAIRLGNIKDAYEDIKTNAAGVQWTSPTDKLFLHYIMAFKMSKGQKKIFMKNFAGLGAIGA